MKGIEDSISETKVSFSQIYRNKNRWRDNYGCSEINSDIYIPKEEGLFLDSCARFANAELYNKADLATSNTNSFRTSKLIRNAIQIIKPDFSNKCHINLVHRKSYIFSKFIMGKGQMWPLLTAELCNIRGVANFMVLKPRPLLFLFINNQENGLCIWSPLCGNPAVLQSYYSFIAKVFWLFYLNTYLVASCYLRHFLKVVSSLTVHFGIPFSC